MGKSIYNDKLIGILSKKLNKSEKYLKEQFSKKAGKDSTSPIAVFCKYLKDNGMGYLNIIKNHEEKESILKYLQNDTISKPAKKYPKEKEIIKKKVVKVINKTYQYNNIIAKPPILDKLILKNGISNGEIYFYFYVLENALRKFILEVLNKKKPDWWDKVNSRIKSNVDSRKKKEKWNPWVTGRGAHEIYYTDLSDLSNIIKANQSIFTTYFDKMEGKLNWLTHRIDEIYLIRNNLAHACPIGNKDINLFKTYFQNIYDIIENLNNSL